MNFMPILLLFWLFLHLPTTSAVYSGVYENCIELSSRYDVTFHWTLDTAASKIHCKMRGRLQGYLLVGLVPTNSDAAWLDKWHHEAPNSTHFADLWVHSKSPSGFCANHCFHDTFMMHKRTVYDDNNNRRGHLTDVELINDGTYLQARFSRALSTGDPFDIAIPSTSSTSLALLWAGHLSSFTTKTVVYNPPEAPTPMPGPQTLYHEPPDKGLYAIIPSVDFARTPEASCVSAVASSSSSTFQAPDNRFSATWQVVVNGQGQQQLEVTMQAPTLGYVAFGFGPTEAHASSDYIIGYVDDVSGAGVLLDTYSAFVNIATYGKWLNNDTLQQDQTQDVQLVTATQTATTTTITYRRPLLSTDARDQPIYNQQVLAQYATHHTDDVNAFHALNRGSAMVNFLVNGATAPPTPQPPPPPPPGAPTVAPPPSSSPMATLPPTVNSEDDDDNQEEPIFTSFTSENGMFSLSWTPATLATADDAVRFSLSLSSAIGYASFGLGPAIHEATDMYVAMVLENGTITVVDGYSDSLDMPSLDAVDNVADVRGDVVDGRLSVSFTRLIDTGDKDEDVVIEDRFVEVQWAYYELAACTSVSLCMYHEGDERSGVALLNLRSRAAPPSYASLTSAEWLCIALAIVLLLFLVVRFAFRYYRWRRDRQWRRAQYGTTSPPIMSSNREEQKQQQQQQQNLSEDTQIFRARPLPSSPAVRFAVAPPQPPPFQRRSAYGNTDEQQLNPLTVGTLGRVNSGWGYDEEDERAPPAKVPQPPSRSPPPSRPSVAGLAPSQRARPPPNAPPPQQQQQQQQQTSIVGKSSWFKPSVRSDSSGAPPPRRRSSQAEARSSRRSSQRGEAATSAAAVSASSWTSAMQQTGAWHRTTNRSRGNSRNGSRGASRRQSRAYSLVEGGGDLAAAGGGGGSVGGGARAYASTQTGTILRPRGAALQANSATPWLDQFVAFFLHRRVPRTQIPLLDAIAFSLYILLHIGFLFVFPVPADRGIANTLGYLSAANSLFLALPAARSSLLVFLLDLPFDRTIAIHRWLGRWTFLLILAHFIAYPATSAPGWLPLDLSLWSAEQQLENLWALLAFLASCVVVFTSHPQCMRRRHFEAFYWSHFAFFLFYCFAALHSPSHGAYYVYVAAVFYALDRAARLFWGAWPRRTIEMEVLEGDLLRLTFPRHPLSSYRVGSYVFINFPAVSLVQFHPYTLSSGPNDDVLEVYIKALGDHTQRLLAVAQQRQRLWLRVDGPYGAWNFDHRRYSTLLTVVGGVGVTPGISCLKDVYRVGMSRERRSAVAKRDVCRLFVFCWVVPSADVYRWFARVLEQCLERSAKDPKYYARLLCLIYVTRANDEEVERLNREARGWRDSLTFLRGRPIMSDVFDYVEQHSSEGGSARAGVCACGPSALVNQCWDETASRNLHTRRGGRFDIHIERFDF